MRRVIPQGLEATVHELSDESTLDPAAPLSDDEESASAVRMRALYEIGKLLLEQRHADQVIRAIHRSLVEHLAPDHASVLSVLPDGSFRPLTRHRLELDKAEERWPISRTALHRTRDTGLALLATDVMQDPKFEGSGSVHKLGICSVLCVPLGKRPVRGVIYMDRRERHQAFDRSDLQFLTAAAAYAAMILDRIEEFESAAEDLRSRAEQLELLRGELLRHHIVGRSAALAQAYEDVRRFADGGARVLLRGETGTGKELFARAYAANSGRRGKPYIPVPIPALSPTLIESELFGHVKGAFTEASRDKKGFFEVADGGVLFLDEIGDIEPGLQVKLLRFLDSGEIYRVGDTQPRFVDTLIVSATNRPLEKLVEQGRFRADLLARLGHTITVPPLRERREDIPLLVEHFATRCGRGGEPKRFGAETLDLLERYDWEFNVRQLQQVVERVSCLVGHEEVVPDDLPDFVKTPGDATPLLGNTKRARSQTPAPLREVVEEAEREHIFKTLEFTKGNRRKAIELLGISSETFYRRLEDMGLHKRTERS